MPTIDSTIREYFNLIETHVVQPLAGPDLSNSCYATLLMVFGCIDGLGKLIHEDVNASPGVRFKCFVTRMGPNYDLMKDELWQLRNSLVHNALNVAAYLSHVPTTSGVHLRKSSSGPRFVVNSKLLFDDFVVAFRQLERDLSSDETLQRITEHRLIYEEAQATEFESFDTTSPPPVRFVQN